MSLVKVKHDHLNTTFVAESGVQERWSRSETFLPGCQLSEMVQQLLWATRSRSFVLHYGLNLTLNFSAMRALHK